MVLGQAFVVADGAAAAGDPCQGPLDDPAAGQDLEGVQVTGPLDDLEFQPGLERGPGPGDEFAGVAAVSPGQLDRGEGAAQVPQQRFGSVAVLDARGGDQHRQQQSDGVHGDVPLAAVDLLARVIAAAGTGDLLSCPHRLGVDDRGRGLGLAPGRDAALAAQLIVHLPGRPALVPAVGHVIDGAPVRQVRGHRPPLDAFLDQVADRIHVIAAAASRGAAALAGLPGRSGQHRLDDLPFRIAHVRRVPRHPRAAADPARAAAACHRRAVPARTLGMRGSSSVLDRHTSGS